MPQQYSNGFDFTLVGGVDTCIELPAPPRGLLRSFAVKQLSGTLGGFTFNVIDRQDACLANAEISSSFEGSTPESANKLLDPDMHRIVGEAVVAAVSDLSQRFDMQAGYQNRNEQDIRRTPDSRIYLDINSVDPGHFQVSYTCEPVEMS